MHEDREGDPSVTGWVHQRHFKAAVAESLGAAKRTSRLRLTGECHHLHCCDRHLRTSWAVAAGGGDLRESSSGVLAADPGDIQLGHQCMPQGRAVEVGDRLPLCCKDNEARQNHLQLSHELMWKVPKVERRLRVVPRGASRCGDGCGSVRLGHGSDCQHGRVETLPCPSATDARAECDALPHIGSFLFFSHTFGAFLGSLILASSFLDNLPRRKSNLVAVNAAASACEKAAEWLWALRGNLVTVHPSLHQGNLCPFSAVEFQTSFQQ